MTCALPMRDYQSRAFGETLAHVRAGKRAPLLVLPTGGGKTRIGAEFVVRHNERSATHRTVWLAPRIELVKQAGERLLAEGVTGLRLELAGRSVGAPGARVVVSTIQTLIARDFPLDTTTLLVFDEAHHYVSAEWRKPAERLNPKAIRLGLTATPERGDRTPLGDLFDALIVVSTYRELIDRGYLCPIEVFAPSRSVRELAWEPVDAWKKHAGDRPGVVFCQSVEHARKLADDFNAAGYRAACIDGKLSTKTRDADLERFQRGELDILTNVHVLTEGWDAPRAKVCMIARGCAADCTYLQMVGRVMRPASGKLGAQPGEVATLIDLRGVVHMHGMPDERRAYSLEGRGVARAATLALRSCPLCACCFVSAPSCPRCGYDDFPKPKPPRVQKHTLQNTTAANIVSKSEQYAYFCKLVEEAARSKFKPGWVGVRFQQRFGRWPMWVVPKTNLGLGVESLVKKPPTEGAPINP